MLYVLFVAGLLLTAIAARPRGRVEGARATLEFLCPRIVPTPPSSPQTPQTLIASAETAEESAEEVRQQAASGVL